MADKPGSNSTSQRAVKFAQLAEEAGFDVRGAEVDGRKIRLFFKGDAPDVGSVDDELKKLELQVVGG